MYTESPLLYQKSNAPEYVNKRLLIITYFNMGYNIQYISEQLSITQRYGEEIIHIYQTYGLKALLRRDFGLRQKKEQKKLNENELSLLKSLVRSKPPKNQKKWTYNNLTEIINHSGLFIKNISLGALRIIMISKKIDLNAWKSDPLDQNDENFKTIAEIMSMNEIIENKMINDYELDTKFVYKIIKDLIQKNKSVTILNVFIDYKTHYNLPSLSIYKFSKLLKNQLPNWEDLKQDSLMPNKNRENKMALSQSDVDILMQMCEDTNLTHISRMRAKTCLELNKDLSINQIADNLGLSKSMVYRVYHQYKKHGLDCIQTKKRVSTKMNYGPYVTTSIKKYPQLLSDIQAMVSVPPQNKSNWTIESITTELHKINYKISTTSVAKLIKHHQIKY